MLKRIINVLSFITGGLTNIAIVAASVFLVYFALTKAYAYGQNFISEMDNTKRASKEITITIPEGADARVIGDILAEHDFTSSGLMFYLQARLNGTYNLFKSGDFVLNANMSLNDIMDLLQQEQYAAQEDELKVTIVEGLTNKQIANYLEAEGYFTAEAFLEECMNGEYDYPFLASMPDNRGEKRLEGYLFPDTYNLPPDPEPRDLIIRMLNRFSDVVDTNLQAKASSMNLTVDEVVIMASIIEKEIKVADERVLCSAVIHNRLAIDWKLQMCSTVLYALDKRKDRLFDSDLEVDSPYNTYLYPGLPTGPIANPGAAALQAVVNPADVDYIYFVVRNEETGEHFFTASDADFITAKQLYNQKY